MSRRALMMRMARGEKGPEISLFQAEMVAAQGGHPDEIASLAAEVATTEPAWVQIQLLWARTLAMQGQPEQAWAHLDTLATRRHEAPMAFLLCEAALGHPERRQKWEQALALLDPGDVRTRVDILLNLAELSRFGGDLRKARAQFEEAYEALLEQGDEMQLAKTGALLGNFLVELGLKKQAIEVLGESVRRCREQEMTLLLIAEGTILMSLLLQEGRLEEAEWVAEGVAGAATRRRNWIAVVDARLVQAACAQLRGDEARGIARVAVVAHKMRKKGVLAAFNLAKARLIELRNSMGNERFDALLAEGLALVQDPETP